MSGRPFQGYGTSSRAFVWLRWRILVNSLERTGARDTLERFSIAVDKLGHLIGLILFVPSSLALGALAVFAGFGIATGSWTFSFEILRYFILVATVLAFFGPVVLPSRREANVVRLLLLPVPRGVLYLSQIVAAMADPWILLLVPVALGVPIGMAIGLNLVAAAIALLAGLGVLLFVTAASSLVSSVIQLLFRDRRRGEVVMLLLVIVLPLLGMLPSMMQVSSARTRDAYGTRRDRPRTPPPAFIIASADLGRRAAPSELYYRAALAGTQASSRAMPPLLGLFAGALLFQTVAYAAFARMLDTPVSLGARRAGAMGGLWQRTLPGLSPGASAVALTQVRLALRTPRGRSIVAGPLLIVGVFAMLILKRGDVPFPIFKVSTGLSLATFGTFVSMISILPLAMNQFAIDRAGFTRQMLSPLTLGELLAGKAVGNLLVAAIPATFAMVGPALLFRDGSLVLWLSLPLALIATFTLISPVAAALSATFPKSVDLSSIGQSSNAHQAAALLGLLSFAACALPCLAITWVATRVLSQPALAPMFMLAWCAVSFGLSWMAFVPVRAFVANRTENLAHLV